MVADVQSLIVPTGALVLTVAVDVHKNRLEVLWEGWGSREENWGIEHVVLPGEVEDDAIWTELERELRRQFDHAFGCKIGLTLGFVDGGKWPDRVLRFLQRLRSEGSPVAGKMRACRGRGGPMPKGGRFPIVLTHYSRGLAGNLGGHWIGTDAAKDLIYTRARLKPNEDGTFPDGYRHYPMSYDEELIRQMFSEKVSVVYDRGQEIRTYKNAANVRNEGLDLCVYSLAAFRLLRINQPRFEAIEADLKKQAAELKRGSNSPVAGKSTRDSEPRQSNWATGGISRGRFRV